MKKGFALLLAFGLCLTSIPAALAAQSEITANGVVRSNDITQLTAPFSGVLLPFDWETGDVLSASDTLFRLQTDKIYAPVDGTVRAVFAGPGERAEDVLNEYGMLLSIQKDSDILIDASTAGAYNDEDNRRVHAGEVVYFEQSNDRDNEGSGRIVSVQGKDYKVELAKGDFEDGNSVKIYREDTMSTKSCIGSGTVGYAEDVAVSGVGYVLSCAVQEGQKVKRGDVLFEVVAQDADSSLRSAAVNAGADGTLELFASSGAQVYKGQLLAKVHGLKELCVVASVDEMDLGCVQVGGSVTVVFDRYPEEVVVGTVRELGALGVTKQNAAYYDVTIDFFTTLETLPGMNATVYLSK